MRIPKSFCCKAKLIKEPIFGYKCARCDKRHMIREFIEFFYENEEDVWGWTNIILTKK